MIIARVGGWLNGERKYLHKNPLVLVGIVALIGMRGYFALAGAGVLPQNSGCKPSEQVHTSRVENFIYEWTMAHRFPSGDARKVAMVTITEGNEPLKVLNNACDDRAFLSVLVPELESLGAKVIAIDQSYSDESCMQRPENDELQNALQDRDRKVPVPLVVGARVHERGDGMQNADCLVETPRFNFMQTSETLKKVVKNNVHFGLLRLNSDTLKIPLSWWVFPNDAATVDTKESQEQKQGFAYVAAQLADGSLKDDPQIKALLASNEHPYARFVKNFPTWTAMDVICYGPHHMIAMHAEWGECSRIAHIPFEGMAGMAGKVVVVGERIDSEKKPFAGGTRYGMELHADYMEALLQKRFTRRMPALYDCGTVCAFLIAVILLDALAMRSAGTKLEVNPKQLAVATSVLFLAMLAFAAIMLWFRFLFMPYVLFTSVSIASTVVGYFIVAAFTYYNAERKKANLS